VKNAFSQGKEQVQGEDCSSKSEERTSAGGQDSTSNKIGLGDKPAGDEDLRTVHTKRKKVPAIGNLLGFPSIRKGGFTRDKRGVGEN